MHVLQHRCISSILFRGRREPATKFLVPGPIPNTTALLAYCGIPSRSCDSRPRPHQSFAANWRTASRSLSETCPNLSHRHNSGLCCSSPAPTAQSQWGCTVSQSTPDSSEVVFPRNREDLRSLLSARRTCSTRPKHGKQLEDSLQGCHAKN